MVKETITYTDYNGVERKEEYLFNMNKAELMELEMTTEGGLSAMIQSIIDANDIPEIVKIFKKLLLMAYGKKSPDGKRFIKSEELSKEFAQTEAYSELFMELATNAEKAAEFINKMIPEIPEVPENNK